MTIYKISLDYINEKINHIEGGMIVKQHQLDTFPKDHFQYPMMARVHKQILPKRKKELKILKNLRESLIKAKIQ